MAEPIDLSAAYEDLFRSLDPTNFFSDLILFVILLLMLNLNYVTYQDLIDSLGLVVFIGIVILMLKILNPNRPLVGKATSASQAIVIVTPIRSPPGLLDLPPELRIMIFRHLLVDPDGVDLDWGTTSRRTSLDILRANRLIYGEAFEVFYRENKFLNFSGRMYYVSGPQADMIQNIHVRVFLHYKKLAVLQFLTFGPKMGNTSFTHNSLAVDFLIEYSRSKWFIPVRWFVRALGRFTNFKTIELHVSDGSGMPRNDVILEIVSYLNSALEPVLGEAEDHSTEGHGLLRFHPLAHRNRLSQQAEDRDWVDCLDGIRSGWDEELSGEDDSETSR